MFCLSLDSVLNIIKKVQSGGNKVAPVCKSYRVDFGADAADAGDDVGRQTHRCATEKYGTLEPREGCVTA